MKIFAKWNVRDIILVSLIGLFCGVIFWSMNFAYNFLLVALTPLGLQLFAGAILLGFWTLAGVLAGFLVRLPGASILAELIGALLEMLFGGEWGISTLLDGLVQGIGTELGFVIRKYQGYNWLTMMVVVTTTTVVTFTWEYFKDGYMSYNIWLVIGLFIVSYLSVFLFSGVLGMLIIKKLAPLIKN